MCLCSFAQSFIHAVSRRRNCTTHFISKAFYFLIRKAVTFIFLYSVFSLVCNSLLEQSYTYLHCMYPFVIARRTKPEIHHRLYSCRVTRLYKTHLDYVNNLVRMFFVEHVSLWYLTFNYVNVRQSKSLASNSFSVSEYFINRDIDSCPGASENEPLLSNIQKTRLI